MTKKKDLRNTSQADLEKQLKDLRMNLIKANSQIATGTAPKNPGQVKQTKKTIAKILTILNEKKVQPKEENKKE